MNKIAKFEKISFAQFKKDWINQFGHIPTGFVNIYSNIKLPKRSTKGSAGYDFFTPVEIILKPGQDITVPTGIRCKIDDGYFLSIYPRSGLGFKFYERLANSTGIIDSDYYSSDNEGHIMIKLRNDSKDKVLKVECNKGFVQGIFLEYNITIDDSVDKERNGGFGSTDKQ